jgi:hypothetical protein
MSFLFVKDAWGGKATSLKREQAEEAWRSKNKTDVSSDDESDESVHGIERGNDGPKFRNKTCSI